MKKRILAMVSVLLLTALAIGACTPGAAPGADTQAIEKLSADLSAAQSALTAEKGQAAAWKTQLDQANNDLKTARTDKTAAEGKLTAAQAQVTQLQEQLGKVKQDAQLAGATPEETAKKIAKFYNETHVYTTIDLFQCGDMSMDIWNMLKAQNINAKIQIGSTKVALKEIQDSDHAWVMAEIAPGKWLALETTGGFAVTQAENPFYYQGWSFQTPKGFKDYVTLLNEYIVRQNIVNDMVTRYNTAGADLTQAGTLYNQMVSSFNTMYAGKAVTAESQAAQDRINAQKLAIQEKQGRVNQFKEEIDKQKAPLPGLKTKMQALVG